jgi:hypothetical protein
MDGSASSQQAQEASALDQPVSDARDDLALATVLAEAARTVEQIVDLSVGQYGAAVTYGPGKRVEGIVLRRPPPREGGPLPAYCVEAHIVVDTAVVAQNVSHLSHQDRGQGLPSNRHGHASASADLPILLWIAHQTRQALAATLEQVRPHEQWDIDIFIDDLRDAEAPTVTGMQ